MLRFASVFAFLFFALLVLQAAHATTTTKDEEKDDDHDERKRILVERRAEFKSWSDIHEKTYESPDHEAKRFQIWMENDEKINKHNSQIPASSYTMGHNAFSDMTHEEFAAHVGLMTINAESLHHVENEANDIEEDQHPGLRRKLAVPPTTVDWRTKGVLPTVKDSGRCACSYAFAAVGAIESFFTIKTGNLTPALSVQQILDCDIYNFGCSGGYNYRVINYAAKFGLVPDSAYPYIANPRKCRYQEINKTQLYQPKGYLNISTSANIYLQTAISTRPVAVIVDGNSFQNYKSGVIDYCSPNYPNHFVLAVGYDSLGNWILQNCWGTKWGDKGYVTLGGKKCGGRVLDFPYQAA